jgi:predicted phosphodiesterase
MGIDFRQIIDSIENHKGRQKDAKGKPGGLVKISTRGSAIIVGDLHSCHHNLKRIIAHKDNEKKLAKGQAILILTGDTVHNDMTGQLKEMGSSLEMLEYVLELIQRFGERIVYVRGNHDTFDENLVKSGIRQGLEFRTFVQAQRGPEFTRRVEKFFDTLPLFVIGSGYIVTHAGPPRGGATREQLVNAGSDPDLVWQLTWNRINEFRGTPSNKEYDAYDVQKTRERLQVPEGTHFIVGHNPLWNTGNTSGVWLNVLGIANHHILYSGARTRAPYMIFRNGEMQIENAISAGAEALYV